MLYGIILGQKLDEVGAIYLHIIMHLDACSQSIILEKILHIFNIDATANGTIGPLKATSQNKRKRMVMWRWQYHSKKENEA